MMVRVTFLHPDLGIGGAERLIVDAAIALKKSDHSIHMITAHHDRSHCFPETINGQIPVTVVGDWLPRSFYGKFCAFCAYLRMLYAACYLLFFSNILTDVVICDQISACIPILHLKIKTVIFYCHFPDLLQSKPGGTLKRLYRIPLNWIEETTTNMADIILVNSNFTRNTFKDTFKGISTVPEILYPSVNTTYLDRIDENSDIDITDFGVTKHNYFLSINRYERKKNIALAVEAFACLQSQLDPNILSNLKLVIAGGYDNLVQENIDYFKELYNLAEKFEILNKTIFLKSPPEAEKINLIKNCKAIVYTPSNEHFGIVPLEAMYFKKPIIAVCNGGPTETVSNKETGFLCPPNAEAFSEAMKKCIFNENYCQKMGEAARQKFESCFSFETFTKRLDEIVSSVQ